MNHQKFSLACVAVVLSVSGSPAAGSLILYGQQDRDAWFADVGSAETITFTEHHPTILTTQYEASHGLTIQGSAPSSVWTAEEPQNFPNDGIGLIAAGGPMWLLFDREMHAFAVDFPGSFTVGLYSGDLLLHEVFLGSSGWGHFRGVVLDGQSFDRVLISSPGTFGIDDLHFAAIPTPAAWVLALAGSLSRMRRRRC